MKEVTNVDRDCSPSKLFQVTLKTLYPVTPYPALLLTPISPLSRVDVSNHLDFDVIILFAAVLFSVNLNIL